MWWNIWIAESQQSTYLKTIYIIIYLTNYSRAFLTASAITISKCIKQEQWTVYVEQFTQGMDNTFIVAEKDFRFIGFNIK
jgi:hypothetical protein